MMERRQFLKLLGLGALTPILSSEMIEKMKKYFDDPESLSEKERGEVERKLAELDKNADILINIILDKSGSMEKVRDEIIHSFNNFIEEQKGLPGVARISLTLFDTNFKQAYVGIPIEAVPILTRESYRPSGLTALFDAIGKTIGEVRSYVENNSWSGKVLFVILTDGFENSSKEFTTRSQIADLIKQAREQDKFEFVYLGADQDAWAEGSSFGMARGHTYSFTSSPQSTGATMCFLSDSISSYRCQSSSTIDDYFRGKGADEEWEKKWKKKTKKAFR